MQRYIGQVQFYLTNGNCWVDLYIVSREERGNSKFIFLITLTPLVAFLIFSFIWSKKLSLELRNKPRCFWILSLLTGTFMSSLLVKTHIIIIILPVYWVSFFHVFDLWSNDYIGFSLFIKYGNILLTVLVDPRYK